MERKVKYDYAFKLKCVKLVLEKHYSCNYVSNQKGLNESNIRKWVGLLEPLQKWEVFFCVNRLRDFLLVIKSTARILFIN
ncbi:transposase [Flavobacterium sp. RSP29]|uniref:transposase n=1 Tax=Flavobacterium sp. RSP29 TaxID=3401731 RepID=UPI003AAE18AC